MSAATPATAPAAPPTGGSNAPAPQGLAAALSHASRKLEAPADFSLSSYIEQYSGHTKIVRLLFIGQNCPALSTEAFTLAIAELKKTLGTNMYKEIVLLVGPKLGVTLDQDWMDKTDKGAIATQEQLELELNGYMTNLAKENIRVSHTELGDHHYARGDLHTALKCYVRTRDYCSSPAHSLQTCLNVIKVGIELGNWSHVQTYVSKAESSVSAEKEPLIAAQLKACNALANLEGRKYKMAARKLLEIPASLGNNYNTVLSAADIGLIGGLCGLATFDRAEIKKRLLENSVFNSYMELTPGLRDVINDFYQSRYGPCLQGLAQLRPAAELDLQLSNHVEALCSQVRSRALIQYFTPYSSVRLDDMAEAFKTDQAGLQQELATLIRNGHIAARIDSHNRILYARTADQRVGVYSKTLLSGDEYQRNVNSLLLRMSLLSHEFMVRPERRDDDGGKKQHKKDKDLEKDHA